MHKRRYWKQSSVVAAENGFEVLLDGKNLRTPAKNKMHLPRKELAQKIAKEWHKQGREIDPTTMPTTRYANSAIDTLGSGRKHVVGMLAGYAASDLVCYRAIEPQVLLTRQQDKWDPLLAWARDVMGLPLVTTKGLMPVDQPKGTAKRAKEILESYGNFQLAAVHDLICLSGSFVIGLAVTNDQISVGEGWKLSRLDEDYQVEVWGQDEEAVFAKQAKNRSFLLACEHFVLCG